MEIDVVWRGRVYRVEIVDEEQRQGPPAFQIRIGEGEESVSTLSVRLLSRIAGRWTLDLDGRIEDVVLARETDGLIVDHRNRFYRLAVHSRRDRFIREALVPDTSDPVLLKAQMAGRIIRVLKDKGDRVEAGQGVVVIEAMKMQNEVRTPRPGKVRSVQVLEGDLVAAGALLAEIE